MDTKRDYLLHVRLTSREREALVRVTAMLKRNTRPKTVASVKTGRTLSIKSEARDKVFRALYNTGGVPYVHDAADWDRKVQEREDDYAIMDKIGRAAIDARPY